MRVCAMHQALLTVDFLTNKLFWTSISIYLRMQQVDLAALLLPSVAFSVELLTSSCENHHGNFKALEMIYMFLRN